MIDIDALDQNVLANYEAEFIDAYREQYPGYEWGYGSLLYEMVIRPAAVRAAADETSIDTLRANLSLYLASISEEPDEDYVRSLASNFRVIPKAGIYATGEITVYTRQNTNVYVNAGTILNAGGMVLTVDRTYVGVASAGDYVDKSDTVYRQYTPVGNEYAFTIPVRSATFTDASVARGVQVAMNNRPAQVSRIQTATSITGGRAEESTQNIIQQALYGITAKIPSGNSHLAALFDTLDDVNVRSQATFGINDPECIRDRDNVFGISAGGRVDTWCRTSTEPVERTVNITASRLTLQSPWNMFIDASVGAGFYRVLNIKYPESDINVTDENGVTVTYGWTKEDGGPHIFSVDTARYSVYQTALVTFDYDGIEETEATFEVTLLAMPNLATLQEYINRRDVRNEAHDVLVRAPNPASVSLTVTVERDPGDTSTEEADVQAAIAAIINETPIGIEGLDATLLVNAVEALDQTLNVVFPVTMQVDFQQPDGTVKTVRTLTGRIETPASDYSWVTERNTMYYCRASDILVTLKDKA